MNAEAQSLAVDQGLVSLVSKAELDQQIQTARANPRSIANFRKEALALATIDEETADECIYALPRAGKTIEGPSIRFAEIIAYSWGNFRAGTRIVEEGRDALTAQGVFYDLERNGGITREVKRRITNSRGERYNADMISTTANATSSIALRSAIFNAIPRALWQPIYREVRKVVAGEAKTHATKRAETLQALQKVGVTQAMVLERYAYKGVDDITTDDIVELRGLRNAIRDGDLKIEEAFAPKVADSAKPPASRAEQVKESLRGAKEQPQQPTGPDLSNPQVAIAELRATKAQANLDAIYALVKVAHEAAKRALPVEVEAAYHEHGEALKQQPREKGEGKGAAT